jgi:hypothetical protein
MRLFYERGVFHHSRFDLPGKTPRFPRPRCQRIVVENLHLKTHLNFYNKPSRRSSRPNTTAAYLRDLWLAIDSLPEKISAKFPRRRLKKFFRRF